MKTAAAAQPRDASRLDEVEMEIAHLEDLLDESYGETLWLVRRLLGRGALDSKTQAENANQPRSDRGWLGRMARRLRDQASRQHKILDALQQLRRELGEDGEDGEDESDDGRPVPSPN